MIERAPAPSTAVLVSLDFGQGGYDESLQELRLLAASAGIQTRAVVRGRRDRPDAAHFAGSGKVDEIRATLREQDASLAVFNHALSPVQERNLEKFLGCPVVDRTRLILDIFAQRAKSHEGKLQVELARLEYAATRLVRGWTHLERQRGGRGFLAGMGETQIEVDRRLIATRVKVLKDKLAKTRQRREVQRRARERGRAFSISLVGYTNAGKSTLFNALTGAGARAEDRLFATLDTTTRRLYLPEAGNVAISDTVGFIRDLPHTLVAAFRATLEETIHADLLLHVIDAASEARDAQVEEVGKVLEEIGAGDIPQILVWNKIDRNGLKPGVERDEYDRIRRVRLSAKTSEGVEGLRRALVEAAATRKSSADPLNSKLSRTVEA
ncbi:MAG: GTPase HflX [Burkholderiales bacterium]